MNDKDYLRLIDSGADSETIGKMLLEKERAPTQPLNWKEHEHLETDFVSKPPMGIQVEANRFDRPPSQRLFGSPVYDQGGDLRCRCCGQVLTRSMSVRGEGIASCANVGCDANGFAYAEGSYANNPHRPTR